MLRSVFLVAIAMGFVSPPAVADTVMIKAPRAAGTIAAGVLDMVTHFRMTDDDLMEVTAVFAERGSFYRPTEIILGLPRFTDVAFSVPGYPETLYTFSRWGEGLHVSAEPTQRINLAQVY
jgi:hypothetical protein